MLLIIVLDFICFYRQGSVIVDFTVRTSSNYDDPQLAQANDKLINAIEKEIAPVLNGKVPEIQSECPVLSSLCICLTGNPKRFEPSHTV